MQFNRTYIEQRTPHALAVGEVSIMIQPDKQCGVCGAVNRTEQFNRMLQYAVVQKSEIIIRCTNCGHEKKIGEVTYTGQGMTIYATPLPEKEIF